MTFHCLLIHAFKSSDLFSDVGVWLEMIFFLVLLPLCDVTLEANTDGEKYYLKRQQTVPKRDLQTNASLCNLVFIQ